MFDRKSYMRRYYKKNSDKIKRRINEKNKEKRELEEPKQVGRPRIPDKEYSIKSFFRSIKV